MAPSNVVKDSRNEDSLRSQSANLEVSELLLTTTVDGGAGLSTASGAKPLGGKARSRSRSPHPQGQLNSAGLYADNPTKPDGSASRPHQTSLPRPDDFDIDEPRVSDDQYPDQDNHGNSEYRRPLPNSFVAALVRYWEASKGLLMVVLAMFFSSIMGATARLMQTGPNPMHTFQILFARQIITATLSILYMWWKNTPHAPLGTKEVRPLLLARGVGGFFGVFGLYYSVQYLPLAEATVITFLAPSVANFVTAKLLKLDTFTRREQLAGILSLLGVILIAQPFGFLGSNDDAANSEPHPGGNSTTTADTNPNVIETPPVTSAHRLLAVGVSLLGVCGAACAYTTIRWIGKRAHPLISVSYFSTWCTIVSLGAMLLVPGISFRLPVNSREWLLLLSLGLSGIVMQLLLTAGLARQKGSAATNMTYTQMIFVLFIDYTVWGTVMTWASWAGAALILGSQIWGVVAKGKASQEKESVDSIRQARNSDEEVGLVEGMTEDEEEGESRHILGESTSRDVEMRDLRT